MGVTSSSPRSGRRPPRAVMQVLWHLHRLVFRLTGRGLEPPREGRVGTLALRTIGRHSGLQRETLTWYLADGDRLVIVASNAGSDRHPAWFLNLEDNPDVEVRLDASWLPYRARRAADAELEALWPRLEAANADYRSYRESSTRAIPVVILEPS